MRQNQGVCEVLSSAKSERTDFIPYRTLLQVSHPMAAVLEESTKIKAW